MRLKYPSKLEEPFAMSAVANASAKDQRSNRGADAESEVIRESAGVGKAHTLPNS